MTKKTEMPNELKLPSLPTIRIEGKDWEYRAFSPKVIKVADSVQELRNAQKQNPSETMELMLKKIQELMEAVFVDGKVLFDKIDKRLGGDVVAWISFLAPLMQIITTRRDHELEADLERFKQPS